MWSFHACAFALSQNHFTRILPLVFMFLSLILRYSYTRCTIWTRSKNNYLPAPDREHPAVTQRVFRNLYSSIMFLLVGRQVFVASIFSLHVSRPNLFVVCL